ncbi:MAG: MlaD family protein [Vampirovibrionales bacterium]|nr:MlaD family protein [Vampirovibrionales bacterium]
MPLIQKCYRLLKKSLCFCSDMVLWTCLAAGLVISILAMDFKNLPFAPKEAKTLHLYVEDAYALMKGSPVILMGVPVGYVKQVKLNPKDDSVWVDYVLNDPRMQIPEEAEALIVAAGLGGAKSLEFTLDESPEDVFQAEGKAQEKQQVLRPFRQKNMWDAQIKMANFLRQGATSLGKSLDAIPTEHRQADLMRIAQEMRATQEDMHELNQRLPKMRDTLSAQLKRVNAIMLKADDELNRAMKSYTLLQDPQSQQRHKVLTQMKMTRTMLEEQRRLLKELQTLPFKKDPQVLKDSPLPLHPVGISI